MSTTKPPMSTRELMFALGQIHAAILSDEKNVGLNLVMDLAKRIAAAPVTTCDAHEE